MTARRRVVVTGLGMVTPLGDSLASTVAAIGRGDHAFEPPSVFDASGFSETRCAEVKDFDARAHFRVTKALKLTDRATRFAVGAAAMALADARWPEDEAALQRLGVVVGSSGSDLQTRDLASALQGDAEGRSVSDIPFFAERILSGLNPLWLLISLPNMSSAHVAIQFRANGPNSSIMTDWVAGSQAIGEAFEWIREGEADAVIAGGADSGLSPFAYVSYQKAGLFGSPAGDEQSSARFIPAEGAAILLLEEREHAIRRGATIRGELCAYAVASAPLDTEPPVYPEPSRRVYPESSPRACPEQSRKACPERSRRGGALARTMSAALTDAGWGAGDIDAISLASVFAGPYLAMEQHALDDLFGDEAAQPPRTEYRSRLGHALGASGAIDAALLVALGQGAILCNSLGFSGQAVTLAFQAGAPSTGGHAVTASRGDAAAADTMVGRAERRTGA